MTAEQASAWKQVIGCVRDSAGLATAILVARSCRVLQERDDEGLTVVAFDRDYGGLWTEALMGHVAVACAAVYGTAGLRARWVETSPMGDMADPDAGDVPVPRGDTAIGLVEGLRARGSLLAVVPGKGLVAVQPADRVIDPDTYLRIGARALDLAALIREHGTDVC